MSPGLPRHGLRGYKFRTVRCRKLKVCGHWSGMGGSQVRAALRFSRVLDYVRKSHFDHSFQKIPPLVTFPTLLGHKIIPVRSSYTQLKWLQKVFSPVFPPDWTTADLHVAPTLPHTNPPWDEADVSRSNVSDTRRVSCAAESGQRHWRRVGSGGARYHSQCLWRVWSHKWLDIEDEDLLVFLRRFIF